MKERTPQTSPPRAWLAMSSSGYGVGPSRKSAKIQDLKLSMRHRRTNSSQCVQFQQRCEMILPYASRRCFDTSMTPLAMLLFDVELPPSESRQVTRL